MKNINNEFGQQSQYFFYAGKWKGKKPKLYPYEIFCRNNETICIRRLLIVVQFHSLIITAPAGNELKGDC